MSEQFEMLVWRANGVDTNGDITTPTALAMMADGMLPGDDINLNFGFNNSVGKIVQAWVKGDELWAAVVVTDCDVIESIREGRITLRPGFSIGASHESVDGHRVIEKVGLADTNVGLMTRGMPLPSAHTCTLCARSIPDDDKIEVCDPCLVSEFEAGHV